MMFLACVPIVLMIPLLLGRDTKTGKKLYIDPHTFSTGYHLIGGTGTGKTTTILRMLISLLRNSRRRISLFLIDRMGGLSEALLRWMASSRHCPEHVRRRLLYVEPANEQFVLPFNQLHYTTEANLYFQLERAMETILRAWESQDLAMMARLRKWLFNAFLAAALLRYTIVEASDYLLSPGTREHECFLRQLPEQLRYEWADIFRARGGGEAVRILESTRNRLAPYRDSCILRRMFGSTRNHHDVERFSREGRIVIWNVSTGENQLPGHLGRTIGAFAFNDILNTARYLGAIGKPLRDTYVVLDEFQDYASSPDAYDAIPIVRQLGIKLILAHQSLSQLERGDLDLKPIIWQARSRLIFANDAKDADELAHEIASLTWDPETIKHQLVTRRQRIAGYRSAWVQSKSHADSLVDTWNRQQGNGYSSADALTLEAGRIASFRQTNGTNVSSGSAQGGSAGNTRTEGRSETLLPIHEEVAEVSSVTFQQFNEFRTITAGQIRKMQTGHALATFVNDPKVYHVAIERPIIPDSPRIRDAVAELKARNFESDVFLPASEVDREREEIRQRLLQPPAVRIGSNGRSRPTGMERPAVADAVLQEPAGEYLFEDE